MKIKRNFIAMGYQIDSLPEDGVSRREFFTTLIRSVEDGSGQLPSRWAVTWNWRNTEDSELRYDTFKNVIKKSRVSFLQLMSLRLRRDMRKLVGEEPPPAEFRSVTEEETERLEEESEERMTERRARYKKPRTRKAKTRARRKSKLRKKK
jgi:hypothetical protein